MYMETNCVAVIEKSLSGTTQKLPIQCPYEITDPGGLDPGVRGSKGIDLDSVSANFFQQYKAALELVPCDATALRVFTTNEIEGKDYTIGIIFVYDASVTPIIKWLE